MTLCKNPSSTACLKFNPHLPVKFCQACGAAASALGVAVRPADAQASQPQPQYQQPQPRYQQPVQPQYQQPTGSSSGSNFLNVSKPVLNQQALKGGLMASLQAQRTQRLPATISTGLMAAGGLVLGAGFVMIVYRAYLHEEWDGSDLSEPNTALGMIAGLFAIFVGWAIVNWLPELFKTAGVTIINLLIPLTAIVTLSTQLDESGNVGLVLLFAALLSGVVWVLPGTAGRPSLLTFGVAYLALAFAFFLVQSRFSSYGVDSLFDPDRLFDFAQEASTLVLILGAGLVGVGHRLDRKQWWSVGTPFIGLGISFVFLGMYGSLASGVLDGVLDDGDGSATGPAILVLVIASGITYVGGYAGRRLVLGIGTWLIAGLLVGLAVFLAGDEPTQVTLAVLFLIVGVVVTFTVFKLDAKIAKVAVPKP